jgi:hypothetical protein
LKTEERDELDEELEAGGEEEEEEEPQPERQKSERMVEIPRGQLRRLEKKAKRADEAEGLRKENALLKSGLGELTEKQQRALFAAHDGDFTADALKATAVELRLMEAEPDTSEEEGEELDKMDRASKAAASGQAPTGRITPDDAAKWDDKKTRRFIQKYPEEYELLLSGQPVFGITDFN